MRILFIIDDYVIDVLGIGYLSSYLKLNGFEVDIVKAKKENLDEKIKSYQPDVFAYSVTTGKHVYYRDLNKQLKAKYPDVVSVFGGPHVTFFPQYINRREMDYGIMGEGFEAFPELLSIIQSGISAKYIPNVVTKDSQMPLRKVLDKSDLLFPDRSLMYKYPENYNNPIKNVMCSFGCRMNCHYCYSEKYKEMYSLTGSEIRPVDSVIEEIDQLRKYPLSLLFFQDDIFPIYKKEWLYDFCAKYDFKIPFHIQVRVEMLNEEIIRMLKNVGLHGVTFAIESGNEQLRRKVLGRQIADDTILKGAELLRKYDIRFRAENMIGIPNETIDTALQTLDMNLKCKPTIAWASVFQPYPGTKLGDQYTNVDIDEITDSFFDGYVLDVPNHKQFSRLQKLFPVIVENRYLRRFVRILMNLPLDKLYYKLFLWYKKRLYIHKLYAVD